MVSVTIYSDFGAQENKVYHCFHCFPIYFPWSDGTAYHDLRFLLLNFKPTFSLSSFTFNKRLFSSSSLSVIRVVPFAYLRLLTFICEILISAYASSSLAFHMMYAAHKLNKQGDSIALTYLFLNLEPVYWDCNKNCHFPVLWPLLSFPNLLAYWVQQFHNIIF